jgi:uncharacterized protein involved in exopolysaccharide biosynthesis
MQDIVSLREVVRFTVRNRVQIALSVAAAFVALLVPTFLMAPTYESTALLLVKFGREYIYRPEVGDREVVAVPANRDRQAAQLNTELQILRSEDLMRSVVRAVGVNRLYPDISGEARPPDAGSLGAAVSRLSTRLDAQRVPETDVIRVSFRHTDAAMTAAALTLFLEHFKAKHLEAFSDPQAAAFLQEKVDTYGKQLRDSEEKLKAWQLRNGSFSVEDQRAARSQQRRDLDAALKSTRSEIAGLRPKLAYLRSEREKSSADPTHQTSEQRRAITDAQARLLELQLTEQKLRSSFTDANRNLVSVRNQIQLVKEFLDQQSSAAGEGDFVNELDRQVVTAAAELRFQEARRTSLEEQIGAVDRQLAALTEQDAEFRGLIREREANEKNYETYRKKLDDSRVLAEMDREKIANISVIQAPTVPLEPIWPSRKLNALVGVFLGLCVGYGSALAREHLGRAARSGPRDAIAPRMPEEGSALVTGS